MGRFAGIALLLGAAAVVGVEQLARHLQRAGTEHQGSPVNYHHRVVPSQGIDDPLDFEDVSVPEFDFPRRSGTVATSETKDVLLMVMRGEDWEDIEAAAQAAQEGRARAAEEARQRAGYGFCEE